MLLKLVGKLTICVSSKFANQKINLLEELISEMTLLNAEWNPKPHVDNRLYETFKSQNL